MACSTYDDWLVLTTEAAVQYLAVYADKYRTEYKRLTADPPDGAGFPPVVSSPYLEDGEIVCLLALDGAVVLNQSHEPAYQWTIAGGPALMVDYPDPNSRVPGQVIELLRSHGLLGKPIGIYRVTFPTTPVPDEIWQGLLPSEIESTTYKMESGLRLQARRFDLSWAEVIQRLTFGAYGPILDLKLPSQCDDFWQPIVVRDLGFMTADRQYHRFFHYLEFTPHIDDAAWDPRGAWARARVDVRRDMAHAIAISGRSDATISLGPAPYDVILERFFRDRLQALDDAVSGFAMLLQEKENAEEAIFQRFIEDNPLLLDVYGDVISRPKFEYPSGLSPLGKQFVEPDFIIRYPDDRYTIVEIERPSKPMATKQGQARAEVTQSSFQIAEFKDYIFEHYDKLKDRFPGINRSPATMVVISRSREASFGGRQNVRRQIQLLREQLGVDELLTYDELLERARTALVRLSGLPIAR